MGDTAGVVGVVASVVRAAVDADEEVISTDRIYASSVVVAMKLFKPTVNVKPPAMAAKSGMMASCSSRKLYAHLLPGAPLSTKANRQSTLGYTYGSSLSADRCASYELDGDARHRQGFYPGSPAVWA